MLGGATEIRSPWESHRPLHPFVVARLSNPTRSIATSSSPVNSFLPDTLLPDTLAQGHPVTYPVGHGERTAERPQSAAAEAVNPGAPPAVFAAVPRVGLRERVVPQQVEGDDMKWKEATLRAVRRLCERKGSKTFTRAELQSQELTQIARDTSATGRTPHLTLDRVMQELRDEGWVAFVDDRGHYRLLH